jgi:excisionase family DNA binding protein
VHLAQDGDAVILTVEEAAQLLRISRGLAYDQARRWLATGGREGLPVIRIGRVLRVPRCQLDRLLTGEDGLRPRSAPRRRPPPDRES